MSFLLASAISNRKTDCEGKRKKSQVKDEWYILSSNGLVGARCAMTCKEQVIKSVEKATIFNQYQPLKVRG